MWERSVHIPLGGENVVIYQLSSCLKKCIQSYIVYSMCYEICIYVTGAKPNSCYSVQSEIFLWLTAFLGSAVPSFVFWF